jgi:predicted sulfurtransferase
MLRAYEEIGLVIRTLEQIRTKVNEFHHDCFVFAKELALKVDVDIKRARTCQRQRFRQNAIVTEQQNPEQVIEDYFRVNVTVPFLVEVVGNMKNRFEDGQAAQCLSQLVCLLSLIGDLR